MIVRGVMNPLVKGLTRLGVTLAFKIVETPVAPGVRADATGAD